MGGGGVLSVSWSGGGQEGAALGEAVERRVFVPPGLQAHASQHLLQEGTSETWPNTCEVRLAPTVGTEAAPCPGPRLAVASLCGLGPGPANLCVCFPTVHKQGRLIHRSFSSFQTC